MKKIVISSIALTVFAIMVMQSCNSSSSKLDKFIGTWKRTDKVDDDVTIKKDGDAILIIIKKDTLLARYDKRSSTLKFWALSNVTVSYNEKNDHLLANNGKDGEAKRIK